MDFVRVHIIIVTEVGGICSQDNPEIWICHG